MDALMTGWAEKQNCSLILQDFVPCYHLYIHIEGEGQENF